MKILGPIPKRFARQKDIKEVGNFFLETLVKVIACCNDEIWFVSGTGLIRKATLRYINWTWVFIGGNPPNIVIKTIANRGFNFVVWKGLSLLIFTSRPGFQFPYYHRSIPKPMSWAQPCSKMLKNHSNSKNCSCLAYSLFAIFCTTTKMFESEAFENHVIIVVKFIFNKVLLFKSLNNISA